MWQYGADQELIPRVFITNYLTDGGDYQIALCNYAMRLTMHWKVHGICRSLVLYSTAVLVQQYFCTSAHGCTCRSLYEGIVHSSLQFSAQQFSAAVHGQYVGAVQYCSFVHADQLTRVSLMGSACKGSAI